MEYNKDTTKMEPLLEEYEKIKNHLEELLNTGKITEYTKCTITDMSNKVLEHIAEKYKNVREGVSSVMGGKVLEYESKTIKNEGMQEGLQKGRLEMLFDLVRDNLLSIKDAASQAKLTEETFREKMMENGR